MDSEQCETNLSHPVNESEGNIYQSPMTENSEKAQDSELSQTSGKPCTSSALDSAYDGKDMNLTAVKKAPESESQTPGKPCSSSVNDGEGSNNYHQETELACCTETPQTSEGERPNVDEEVCQKKHIKIRDIGDDIFKNVCKRLQFENARGNDWRGLAGQLDYTVDEVRMFKLKPDSAEEMLHDWDCRGHYLDELVKKLLDMERLDVADLLEKEIKRIGEGCNCVNCGSIR